MVTNINYDQNCLSIFLKTTNNQIEMTSDKIYTQKTKLSRLEMRKRGKVY